jgi:HAD superfamily hydrolase (TIGR01544 family)
MKDNIVINNPKEVEGIISKMKEQGHQALHIVTDFDRTLTRAIINGKKSSTSYDGIREGNYFGEEFNKKDVEMYNKYYPMEISTTLSHEEKFQAMNEWWDVHFNLTVNYGITREIIKDIAKRKSMKLRDKVPELFEMLNTNNIPTLIFSAGLGDVIKEFLNQQKLIADNIHIISNFFEFDENGVAKAHSNPLIHTLNKNEVAIKNFPYHNEIENRKNIILLGDSLGDLGMSEGMKYDALLKIGFLNKNTEKNIEEYKEKYDVVITDDGDFDYVNTLLKSILENNK